MRIDFHDKKKTKMDSPSSIKLVKWILLFDAVCKKLSVSRMHSLKFKGIVINYLILRYGTRSSLHTREEEKIISIRSSICALLQIIGCKQQRSPPVNPRLQSINRSKQSIK